MEAHDFFLTLLIILLTARVFAELATRLKSPAVIGELFAGVLLGPSLLGWIEPTEAIRLMAGIGIILLLFEVGLETDVKRLVRTGLESVVVALAGFVLPLVVGFALAYGLFELPLLVSLFIGGTLIFLPLGVALRADEAFAERIETQVKPIVQLFTPIFFVMVGLSLNLREIDWSSPFIWIFSLALLVAAIAGKLIGALLVKESWPARRMIGTAMISRGEVGLIFAELGRESGIFSNEIYAGMVIVIALTTLLPPFVMKWYYGHYGDRLQEATHGWMKATQPIRYWNTVKQ
ncbi:MAG: cation:proton antiporter [Thiogranum sp.]